MARVQRCERGIDHEGDLVVGDFGQRGNQGQHQYFLFSVRKRLEVDGRAVLAVQRQAAVFADFDVADLFVMGDFLVQAAYGFTKRVQFAAAQLHGQVVYHAAHGFGAFGFLLFGQAVYQCLLQGFPVGFQAVGFGLAALDAVLRAAEFLVGFGQLFLNALQFFAQAVGIGKAVFLLFVAAFQLGQFGFLTVFLFVQAAEVVVGRCDAGDVFEGRLKACIVQVIVLHGVGRIWRQFVEQNVP